MRRRDLLAQGLAALAAPALLPRLAFGQAKYPDRPIRLIVPFPPGGAYDTIGRPWADRIKNYLGTVVVENIGGAGGGVGAAQASRSRPDGYTLLLGGATTHITEALLKTKPTFDPLKDLTPVSSLISNQLMLAVHPSVPADNLREFVELARRTKPPLFYASIGNGSQHHLAMEMLKQHVGIDLQHVPYRGGGPAGIALLAGETSAMFGSGSLLPTIKSGKVRGLAVTGAKRFAPMPELPAIGEVYPGYEVLIWHGLFAPTGTPQPILDRLRTEVQAALQQPNVRERLIASGSGEPYFTTPEEFQARIRGDNEKYGKLIKAIGLRIE